MKFVQYVMTTVLAMGLLATHLVAAPTPASQRGTIEGRIVDAETKDILIGSSIAIVGGLTGTRSDVEGDFSLSRLDPGT
ncbi:MAG: carboxypeptidase-like regulatory domain-containing protein, partial [candidate division Zixibacteria bacterium]|nr:carboxypeptidase-like regulatory domain-containing protein [candidate division Zixibacteria bacterium]